MSNIARDGVLNFFEVPGEHHLSNGQRDTHGLRPVGMRRYRKRIWIGDYIDERGPRVLQRLLEARGQISGILDSYTHHADGFGKLREVWILQVRLKVWKSPGFHLQLHHSQGAVVEHHHFDREVVLRHGQDVAQAHRKTAVAAHRTDLP